MSAALLAHDVGKYIARVARNVQPGQLVPPPLVPMLIKDLYALPGKKKASERFEELATGIDDDRIAQARACLKAIDALERRVRAAEPDACREACALARQVEELLRALARDTK